MSDLIAVYKNMHDRDLQIDVSDDTSGSFKKAMISLLQGNRDTSKTINKQQVAKDASDLIQAGEKMLGTDEVVFNRILCASGGGKNVRVLRNFFVENTLFTLLYPTYSKSLYITIIH